MNYENQAINKDLSLVKIKLMLISVVIVIITKEEIKNFKKKSIIYTIFIASKCKILPKSREVARYLPNSIVLRLAYLAIVICCCGIVCFYYITILLQRY